MKRKFLFLLLFPLLSSAQTIDSHFKIDQIGYRPNDKKIAVISNPQTGYNAPDPYTPGATLEVRKESDQSVVFSAAPVAWNGGATHAQSGDKAWWFDFSSVTIEDDYYINDPANNKRSYSFKVSPGVYNDALKHATRMYFYQRCGLPKDVQYAGSDYSDVPCHVGTLQDIHCRDITAPGNVSKEKDMSGGWHDAGDFNKYVNFTFATMHYLLDAYEQNPSVFMDDWGIPESNNGVPDIIDEIKVELDWLMKMQEADGSVHEKLSTQGFQSGNPPSSDTAQRFYGETGSSAARTLCSIFAHASKVFGGVNDASIQAYATTLLTKSQLSWTWLQNNPGYSSYPNTGFSSANPEISNYAQDAVSFTAAVYLFAATGNTTYRTFIDNNYANMHPYQWTYWYPFEAAYQDAMLYYCNTPNATASVVNNIKNNCISSVSSNNGDLLPSYLNKTDAYMAQMQDQDYVWGNNQNKSETGSVFYNMVQYNLNAANLTNYKNAAENYIHYLHGVNATGYCFLSNSTVFGADNSIREIYHNWFGDGTQYDGGHIPYIGPPPGYVTGGVNKNYSPDAAYVGPVISPPQNQPVQKSYKDWNTSWPENSWEITEPAIYTNAAYIKLLSKFADSTSVITSVKGSASKESYFHLLPNPAKDYVSISSNADIADAEIDFFSAIGQRVLTSKAGDKLIDISSLPAGVYFYSVKLQDVERTFSGKLIVNK